MLKSSKIREICEVSVSRESEADKPFFLFIAGRMLRIMLSKSDMVEAS